MGLVKIEVKMGESPGKLVGEAMIGAVDILSIYYHFLVIADPHPGGKID